MYEKRIYFILTLAIAMENNEFVICFTLDSVLLNEHHNC